jgi:hypothetical protein
MQECVVDGGRPGGVVGDEHDRGGRRQGVEHGGELGGLVVRGARVPGGLVRGTPAEEVDGQDAPRLQVRDQPVVEPQVVGEAVQEHDGRIVTGVVLHVDAVPEMGDGVDVRSVGAHRDSTHQLA